MKFLWSKAHNVAVGSHLKKDRKGDVSILCSCAVTTVNSFSFSFLLIYVVAWIQAVSPFSAFWIGLLGFLVKAILSTLSFVSREDFIPQIGTLPIFTSNPWSDIWACAWIFLFSRLKLFFPPTSANRERQTWHPLQHSLHLNFFLCHNDQNVQLLPATVSCQACLSQVNSSSLIDPDQIK